MNQQLLEQTIRTIPGFPKPGIMFKDITPVLRDVQLCKDIAKQIAKAFMEDEIDVVAGVESRGFLFGMLIAQELGCSFAIIRKKGKLPYKTVELE
jgi:adenine phosphoribosyltransferase